MKRIIVILFLAVISNVIFAQRGDTEPPDDAGGGGGTGGGGGGLGGLLQQLQDEDGDGIPDALEGIDGIPTNLTGVDLGDLAGVDIPDSLTGDVLAGVGLGDAIQPSPDLVNQLLNATGDNEAIPPELLALAAQLGVIPGGGSTNSGQLLQYLLLQEMGQIISDLQNFQIIPLSESGYAVTPFGIIQEHCYNDLVTYIADLQDTRHYAWKMASSSGNPGIIISGLFSGNFQSFGIMEQCVGVHKRGDVPIDGQYCLLDLTIRELSLTVSLGTCWPQSCSDPDLRTTLNTVLPEAVTNATYVNFRCIRDLPWSSGAIATLCILSFFGALVAIGTSYHLIVHDRLLRSKESPHVKTDIKPNGHIARENAYVQKVHISIEKEEAVYENDFVEDGKTVTFEKEQARDAYKISDVDEGMQQIKKQRLGGTTDRLLMSFSAVASSTKLFDCSQSSTTLGALNGIRVLSMFWIILGHSFQFFAIFRADNPVVVFENTFQHYTFWAILNGVYAVDTFFFLSGLLLTFLTLKQMAKANGKINWALFYLHRIWRITPVYMIVLAIWTTLGIYMGKGPGKIEAWEQVADICKDKWWTNLLYINNLYPFPGDLNEQCIGWSWYLANDMQFFVISPVILVLLYRYWKAGIASIVGLLLVSFTSSIYLTLYWGLGFGFSGSYNNRTEGMGSADLVYGKPYTRIPPYLVGMLLGFSLYKLKGRQIKLNKYVNITMWFLALAVSVSLVYGPEGTNKAPIYTHLPPQWLSVVYNTFSRFAFALTLAWIVFACVTGHGGLINSFLSQSFWVPLARLTFGAYLIHPVLMAIALTTRPVLMHFTYVEITYFSISNVVLSYAVAYILSLLIESPTLGIEKALIGKKK